MKHPKEEVFSVNDGFSWAYTVKFTLNTQPKAYHSYSKPLHASKGISQVYFFPGDARGKQFRILFLTYLKL